MVFTARLLGAAEAKSLGFLTEVVTTARRWTPAPTRWPGTSARSPR